MTWKSCSEHKDPIPLEYSMKNMIAKDTLKYGQNDNLADPNDVRILLSQKPNLIYLKTLTFYSHLNWYLLRNHWYNEEYKYTNSSGFYSYQNLFPSRVITLTSFFHK